MSKDLHDLAAPYALNALDDEDRAAFERHLDDCEECRTQLAELQEATSALAYAAEGPAPSPELRGRILDAARRDGQAAKVIPFPKRRWIFPTAAAAAAVAAIAAIAVGVWAVSLSRDLDREREAKDTYERAFQLLGGDARVTRLVDAEGGLLVAGDGSAALVVCGLPPAPSAQTYEAWVIGGNGGPKPAGLFRGGSGCPPVLLTRTVPEGAVVAVTLERKPGAQKPTRAPFVRSEPV
jgi:anti-sigma-K factor RskA